MKLVSVSLQADHNTPSTEPFLIQHGSESLPPLPPLCLKYSSIPVLITVYGRGCKMAAPLRVLLDLYSALKKILN